MIAEVIINNSAKQLDRTFDYNVPNEMQNDIKIGSRVLVPFGNMKKLEEGFIVGFKETTEYKAKDIAKIGKESTLNESKVELAKWIAKRYFCNLSESIKLMLPPGTKTKNIEKKIPEVEFTFVEEEKSEEERKKEIEMLLKKRNEILASMGISVSDNMKNESNEGYPRRSR